MWEWLSIASDLLRELLMISARAALVVLLVLGIRVAGRRVCGKYRCMLWLAAAVSFLVPISMRADVTVPYEIVQDISENDIVMQLNEIRTESAAQVQTVPDLQAVAALIWLAGMLNILGIQLYRYQKTKHRLGTAVRMQDNIFCTDQVASPFLFGIVRPRIYLPLYMEAETAAYAIRHERMHLQRKDSQIKFLVFLICTVYWWNPFVWLMYSGLANDMERACDEMVLEMEGSSSVSYAQSILDAAVGRNRIGFGLTFAAGNTKERVKNILHFKKAGNLQRAVCLALGVLVALPSVLQLQAQERTMTQIWQEIAVQYPDFPEHLLYENRDMQFQQQDGMLQIYLLEAQSLSENDAFHELTSQMALRFLECCQEAEEVDVNWKEPLNPKLSPYDKEWVRHTFRFR